MEGKREIRSKKRREEKRGKRKRVGGELSRERERKWRERDELGETRANVEDKGGKEKMSGGKSKEKRMEERRLTVDGESKRKRKRNTVVWNTEH